MDEYQYKYFKINEGHQPGVMMQRMDEKLALIREQKGEYYANICEFMIGTKLMSMARNMKLDGINDPTFGVKLTGRFLMQVIKHEYGDSGKVDDFMADVDDMTTYMMAGEES